MKLKSMKVNSAAIEAGRWVDDIPDMEDLRLHVRGIDNRDYRALQTRLIETIPRERRLRGLLPEDRDRIQNECLIETVLLGWDNVTDDDKTPVPFSKDLARQMIEDPDMARFRGAVVWAAALVSEENAADQKAAEGNSPTP